MCSARKADGLTVELLPAQRGESVLLGWGPPDDRHHLLVDAGPAPAYPGIKARLTEIDRLDLLVLTHVDADHVEGVILLVNDGELGLDIGDMWFNGWKHLGSTLAGPHGEILTALVTGRGMPWNAGFGGGAVVRDGATPYPFRELAGGLQLTVLGPDIRTLRALRDDWLDACAEAGFATGSPDEALRFLHENRPRLTSDETYLSGPSTPDVRALAGARSELDRSTANASTIVLLAEYGDTGVLLCGDATPVALDRAVTGLLELRGQEKLALAAVTVPHHGSRRNVTRELVRKLPARHYLFSSDGSYYKHPHAEAVATVVEHAPAGAQLVFNYATPSTLRWDDSRLRKDYRFATRYPGGPALGVSVDLASGGA